MLKEGEIDMRVLICRPAYFDTAAREDIERELIGLVLEEMVSQAPDPLCRMNPQLRAALRTDPDSVRVQILTVRRWGYHPPSRPGWTPLPKVRWSLHRHWYVEVKFILSLPVPS